MTLSDAQRWFRANPLQGSLLFEEPLSKHAYYKIGGPAHILALPINLSDLKLLKVGVQKLGIPFFIMGAGSNLLISDSGYPGLIIKTSQLNKTVRAREGKIVSGGGLSIATLLKEAAKNGWEGFECLAGIPGLVGGAVVMNGGTHLGEVADLLQGLEAFSMQGEKEFISYSSEELAFEYRKNLFLPEASIILSAAWNLKKGNSEEVRKRIQEVLLRRKNTQPLEFPSCGSVFKNPPGEKAWEFIDKVGLRGHRIGDAQISEKHPNWIVNLGQAKAKDVESLIRLVQLKVREAFEINLESEVHFLS